MSPESTKFDQYVHLHMSMLHRVEEYGDNHIEGEYLVLSFDTKYRGIWQCRWTGNGMSEFPSQHPFESLTDDEQKAINEIGTYVFYVTHNTIPNT